MANETPGTRLRVENRRDGGDADLDFLRDAGANGVDGQAVAEVDDTGFGAGALSHREPLWAVRRDDARSL